MIVTIEFLTGLIIIFLIGFLIASLLEKIFHVNFDDPHFGEIKRKAKKT
jgi:hypothetical protein